VNQPVTVTKCLAQATYEEKEAYFGLWFCRSKFKTAQPHWVVEVRDGSTPWQESAVGANSPSSTRAERDQGSHFPCEGIHPALRTSHWASLFKVTASLNTTILGLRLAHGTPGDTTQPQHLLLHPTNA
jgi:hypothetical protein